MATASTDHGDIYTLINKEASEVFESHFTRPQENWIMRSEDAERGQFVVGAESNSGLLGLMNSFDQGAENLQNVFGNSC